jgi:general secretion pathway protein G
MRKRKSPITLIEIMIVIFLIGLIGGVIGYNMKGSLDEGRAFKSETGAERLRELLLLAVAKGDSVDEVLKNAEEKVASSGLVTDVKKLFVDGWGEPYTIEKDEKTEISVASRKLEEYKKKKKQSGKK